MADLAFQVIVHDEGCFLTSPSDVFGIYCHSASYKECPSTFLCIASTICCKTAHNMMFDLLALCLYAKDSSFQKTRWHSPSISKECPNLLQQTLNKPKMLYLQQWRPAQWFCTEVITVECITYCSQLHLPSLGLFYALCEWIFTLVQLVWLFFWILSEI